MSNISLAQRDNRNEENVLQWHNTSYRLTGAAPGNSTSLDYRRYGNISGEGSDKETTTDGGTVDL